MPTRLAFSRCRRRPEKDCYPQRLDGAKLWALDQHIPSLPEFAALDHRELGFGEAVMRNKRVRFALHLGTADRPAHLECSEDLDAAWEHGAQELR